MNIEYKDYQNLKMIPGYKILLVMTFTLGLYSILWLFYRFQEMDLFFNEKFNQKEYLFVFLLLPLFWLGIAHFLKSILLSKTIYYIVLVLYISFQILYILKFLFDFCFKFGKLTNTDGSFWFFLLVIGLIGYAAIPLKNIFIFPIILLYILTITAIQLELNKKYQKYNMKKTKNIFYDV